MAFFKFAALVIFLVVLGCSYRAPQDRIREYSTADPGFVIQSAVVTFARLEAKDPKTWQTSARLNIKICLSRTFGWRQMEPGIPFAVELADAPAGAGQSKQVSTLSDGCFEYAPAISYPFAQKSVAYLKKYLVVRGVQAEFEGLARTRKLFIDPWNQASLTDWSEDDQIDPAPADSGALQLHVQGLSLKRNRTRRQIFVDRDLKLSFRYTFTFSFFDHYARLREMKAAPIADSVWPGTRFMITGALLAPNLDSNPEDSENLTTYRRLAGFRTYAESDRNGQVITAIPLQLRFEDVPFLDARPRIVFDIVPLSETDAAPEPVHLMLNFDPRAKENTYVPDSSTATAEDLLRQDKSLKVMPLANSSLFVRASATENARPEQNLFARLDLHSTVPQFALDDPNLILPAGLSREEVARMIDRKQAPPEILKHFFYLFAQPVLPGLPSKTDEADFLTDPQLFVRTVSFTVADKVSPVPAAIQGDLQTLSVAANVFKQTMSNAMRGEGDRTASASSKTDISSVGFNAFGIGRTINWNFEGRQESYQMREVTTVNSDLVQNGLNRVRNFYANHLALRLDGSFRDCLLISFMDAGHSNFEFCKARSAPLDESYYYVTDQAQTEPFAFLDSDSLSERALVNIFRGQSTYESLQTVLGNSHLNIAYAVAPGAADTDPAGVSHFETSDTTPSFENLLNADVDSLQAVLGAKSNLQPDQLKTYMAIALRKPQSIFANAQTQADFEKLGSLLASHGPDGKIAYLKILNTLRLSMASKGLKQEEARVLDFARRLNQ